MSLRKNKITILKFTETIDRILSITKITINLLCSKYKQYIDNKQRLFFNPPKKR